MKTLHTSGHLTHNGYKRYYEVFGKAKAGKPPLLVLHGGPGSAHNYLLGLEALARKGRQVIFYDQLGCGLSDRPNDDSLWTIETFVDEVAAVRQQLGLDEVDILGHSWGGMLAINYLLTKPAGVRRVVLASAMISMPLYQAEVEILKKALPPDVSAALAKHEKAGTTDSMQYQRAYQVYKDEHLFRGKHWPKELERPEGSDGDASYKKMWGPSEAFANGAMKKWDTIPRLHEITVPTLITSGQYDELTPYQAEITRREIPNSELLIVTGGSHSAHIEYPNEYVKAVETFLNKD